MTSSKSVLSPWRFVVAFGFVSMLADAVYEGARSIIGPYLATLGASAALVGLVAGAGEFIGYGLRVISGYAVTRNQRYWFWTILGYALTVLSVPFIGASNALIPALLLYGSERLGKAVRSPAKDTLLSFASSHTGRGSAFGVHQALDQTGAIAGPLILAAVLTAREGDYALAFGVLAIPGLAVLALLFWLRSRVPDPRAYEYVETETLHPDGTVLKGTSAPITPIAQPVGIKSLGASFWRYAAMVAVLSCGLIPFPLLAFHAERVNVLTAAQIPLAFAIAMAVDGATGLLMGRLYDRHGSRVLLAVPIAAATSAIAMTTSGVGIWFSIAIWGAVAGVMDSTMKAVVTELVPQARRAIGFGWLALVRGGGLLLSGSLLGLAYDINRASVIVIVLVANAIAIVGLARILRTKDQAPLAS